MAIPTLPRPRGVTDTALPIDLQEVIARLAMHPEQTEAFLAGLAAALIQEADRLDPDPDLEDGGDTEPNCGSGSLTGAHNDEAEDCSEDEGACIQSQPHDEEADEFSLGWSAAVDQTHLGRPADDLETDLGSLDRQIDQSRWSKSGGWWHDQGAELDRSDYEPSLGAPIRGDQRHWADGDTHDREENGDELDQDERANGVADMDGLCEQWPGMRLPNSNGGYIA